MLKRLLQSLKTFREKRHWRAANAHNETVLGIGSADQISVGNHSYGVINLPYYGARLTIGNYVSIADDVVFLSSGEHRYTGFTTFPVHAKILHGSEPYTTKGDIVVEDDVWIGYGATILSGVTIGQGAVIGARAVVAKDVPPYAVYVGYGIIKYRYNPEAVEKMKKFDFGKLTADEINTYKEFLDKPLDETFFSSSFYTDHLKD